MVSIDFVVNQLKEIRQLLLKRDKPFVTIEEASTYLGISKNTLYAYTSKGIIPYYKLQGRRLYFAIADLDEFVLNQRNRSASQDEIEREASTRVILNKRGENAG